MPIHPTIQIAFDARVRSVAAVWSQLTPELRGRATTLLIEAAQLLDDTKAAASSEVIGRLQNEIVGLFMTAKSYDNSAQYLSSATDRLCPELTPAVTAWIR